MPLKRPPKLNRPKLTASSKHPAAYTSARLIPSLPLAHANLLQLQQTAGNQFVSKLLQNQWKVVQAARRNKIEVGKHGKSEESMAQDPHFGDWHFQFVVDSGTGRTALFWITLRNYKNRERHVLIDPNTLEPHDALGNDLSVSERKLLLAWAQVMLQEQLAGNLNSTEVSPAPSRHTANVKEEESPAPADAPPSEED